MIARAIGRYGTQRGAHPGAAILLFVVLLSLLAPAISPQNPNDPLGFNPADADHPPSFSWTFLLGADVRGRSVLALLLWGGRVTLLIGVGAALVAALLGLGFGLLACARGGTLDGMVTRLMEISSSAVPLLVLLLLHSRLGDLSPLWLLAVFVTTGWARPARLVRASVQAALTSSYVEGARALGVGRARLLGAYLLPAAFPALAAWTAAAAGTFMALEAGLDFLNAGLPSSTTSWGTALHGAIDALTGEGNWWWIGAGGLALAAVTLALGAVAAGLAAMVDPTAVVSGTQPSRSQTVRAGAVEEQPVEGLPDLSDVWSTWPGATPRGRSFLGPRTARVLIVSTIAALVLGATAGIAAERAPHVATLADTASASALVTRALAYRAQNAQSANYHATLSYSATDAALGAPAARALPWAAWTACPPPLHAARCATAVGDIYAGAGQAKLTSEGLTAVCDRTTTHAINPMAGMTESERQGCGPLGPAFRTLGATSAAILTTLPVLPPYDVHLYGSDTVAGRACHDLSIDGSGRLCIDAQTGLGLRLERLDAAGRVIASFVVTAVEYGTYYAPNLFTNPLPRASGTLLAAVTQQLPSVSYAEGIALFFVLKVTALPPGLTAQTPTFDSFLDDTRAEATEQRLRQTFVDKTGRVVLIVIETTPGSAWDTTPTRPPTRRIALPDRQLLVWQGTNGAQTIARTDFNSVETLLLTPSLSVADLKRIAAGLL